MGTDQVKWWITLNEPWVVAYLGYGVGSMAPGVNGIGDLVYIAGHSLIKAHTEAYHIYNDDFRSTQNGKSISYWPNSAIIGKFNIT